MKRYYIWRRLQAKLSDGIVLIESQTDKKLCPRIAVSEWLIQLVGCIPIWMLNDPIGSVRSTGYYLNVPTCYMQIPLSLCLLLAYPFRFSMGPIASDVYCTVDGQLVLTVAQTDRKLCTTRIVESTYWMPNSTCCLQTHCHWMLSWMSTD